MIYQGFVGGSARAEAVAGENELTMNWFVAPMRSQAAKARLALLPVPGYRAFGATPDVVGSAAWSGKGRAFAVVGGSLNETFADGSITRRGTLATNGNLATISYNAATGQLLITAGGNAYCYVLATNVLTQVLTGVATQGAMVDGFGLVFDVNTGKVQYSANNDFTSWDPTAFFTNSITPDPWQAMAVDGSRQLWLLGEATGQVWYDTGAASNPFQPIPGAIFEPGTAATFSVALAGGAMWWLSRAKGGAGTIVQAKGYTPQQISTPEVNAAIETYAASALISDAEALVYELNGRTFYNLSFPRANATWSIDIDTPSWHQRGVWNAPKNRFDLWAPRVHAYAFGKHLVCDRSTGLIQEMTAAVATEFNSTNGIRRVRRAPGITHEHAREQYRRLEFLMDVGLGLATGQGSNPMVMLRVSDDGGMTWSSEKRASAGRIGEWRRRVYFLNLGISSDRAFELSCSDPIPWRILDAWINPTESEVLGAAA
jgi:hypothetical protein